MRRPVLRFLMVLVGFATLAVYLAGAYLGYLLLRVVWTLRPSAGTLVVGLLAATGVSAFVSYHLGTAHLLRSVDAWELPPERAPVLFRRLSNYAEAMNLDRPTLLIADVGQPNAFALGGALGPGTVVLDERLLELLTFEELAAIVAHELAHIDHRDSLVQALGYSLVETLTGVVVLLLAPAVFLTTGLARAHAWIRGQPSNWESTVPGRVRWAVEGAVAGGLLALTLALLALSRRRELAADDRAATVTGNPLALARALRKIERETDPRWRFQSQLYVRGDEDHSLLRLLSTHPATDERVDRLLARAAETGERPPRRIRIE